MLRGAVRSAAWRSMLRFLELLGFAVAVFIVLHWMLLFVVGRELEAHPTEKLQIGSNGMAFRMLFHADPAVSIAWDALGTKWRFRKDRSTWFVQVPIISTFVASLITGAVARLLRARAPRAR